MPYYSEPNVIIVNEPVTTPSAAYGDLQRSPSGTFLGSDSTSTKTPILFLIFQNQLCHVTSCCDWVCDITHWGCPPGLCLSHGSLASSNMPRSNAAPAPIDGALWSLVCLFYRLAGCELCYAAPLRLWHEPLCFRESYLTSGNNGACYISNRTNTKLEKHKAGVHKLPMMGKNKNCDYLTTGSPCHCHAATGWEVADSQTDAWRCMSPVSLT